MPLTLAEAAQATGLNRSTILRAIKSGKGIRGSRRERRMGGRAGRASPRVPPASAAPKAVPSAHRPTHLVGSLRAQLADMRTPA